MRTLLVIAIVLYAGLCSMPLTAQTFVAPGMAAREQTAQRASQDWNASAAVAERVYKGDRQALSELADLDPVVALPLLAQFAKDRFTDPERAAIALTALKKVRGVRDYFRPRITFLHTQTGGDFDTEHEFQTLALVGTKEAVAAAAPFLFDNSNFTNPEPNSDFSGTPLRYQAIDALIKMKLPDAPTNKPFYEANDEDIRKWRAWWTTHKAEYEQ